MRSTNKEIKQAMLRKYMIMRTMKNKHDVSNFFNAVVERDRGAPE